MERLAATEEGREKQGQGRGLWFVTAGSGEGREPAVVGDARGLPREMVW